jgi:hypothetical protein
MATVPAPRTWTVGELLTAAKLNTDLRDGLNFLLAPPLAILLGPGTTSITNTTTTALPWTSETIDRDGGHDNTTNNTRYTCQTAGYYEMCAQVAWGSGTNKLRDTNIRTGGSTNVVSDEFDQTGVDGGNGVRPISRVMGTAYLSVGTYAEVTVWQDDGFTISLTFVLSGLPRFELRWVSS